MATYTWIGGSGTWGNPANWSQFIGSFYPGYADTGDSVVFDGSATSVVQTWFVPLYLASLTLSDPNATLQVGYNGIINIAAIAMTAGTIDLGVSVTQEEGLNFSGSQTFAGGTIDAGTFSLIKLGLNAARSITTLGSGFTINVPTNSVDALAFGSGAQLVNQGLISATGADLTLGDTNPSTTAMFSNPGQFLAGGASRVTFNTQTIDNSGSIKLVAATRLTAVFDTFSNSGTVFVGNYCRFLTDVSANGSGASSFVNNGVLIADGGLIDFCGANTTTTVSGSGAIDIFNDGSVRAYGGANLQQDVNFQGAGQLTIFSGFANKIVGFSTGDSVDIGGASAPGWVNPYTSGERMVWQSTVAGVQTFALETSANTVMDSLKFAGYYSAANFPLSDDGTGHALITYVGIAHPLAPPADINGDCQSDILWRNASGNVGLWNAGSGSAYIALGSAGSDWQIAGVGDFDGDGKADVLWRNAGGAVGMWSGGSQSAYVGLGGAGSDWQIASVGDFNGDGKADVLWRNTNGAVGMWSAGSGSAYVALGGAGSDWQIAGVGDFNGDGKADVLWRNSGGAVGYWSAGSAGAFVSLGGAGSDWQIAGVGDFDGDGKADVLWRNSGGTVGYWASGSAGAFTALGGADSSWSLAGVGDFNGDGLADVLWRNSSGTVGAWESASGGAHPWVGLGGADASWRISAA